MNLKNFQSKALDALEYWLGQLKHHRQSNDWQAVPYLAWEDIKKQYPNFTNNAYKDRADAGGKQIAHSCIKIPTGGGKTFTAANALMIIMRKWVARQTGLVIWLVPSNAIYEQTLNSLTKKSQWIHQHLKQMSGGRLKIFTAKDNFTRNDIENYLCIMVLTNQSFIEKKVEGKDHKRLKINRTASGYEDFFPDSGNIQANNKFLEVHKGLDCLPNVNIPVSSLINAIRVNRPVVIIDEAHKAKTELAINGTSNLNPSIVLEISATPPAESNILYEATGRQVWEEDMIKLPIRINNDTSKNWQTILTHAITTRNKLEKIAKTEESNGENYVRPIMLVRSDHITKNTRGKPIHADEVYNFLISQTGIHKTHVAIHGGEKRELNNVDLLSGECSIRYIITTDALKEGWDCPFACVLAILGNLKAETSMTQLLGRIMRQPYAKKSKNDLLNSPHVFCTTDDTNKAMAWVSRGLEHEGYKDVKDLIESAGGGYSRPREKTKRKKKFRKCKIYFPKVKFFENKKARDFNYDTDLMPRINWRKLKYDNALPLSSIDATMEHFSVGLDSEIIRQPKTALELAENFDYVYLAQRLYDIIPNIFIAARIIKETIESYQKDNDSQMVYMQRINIVEHIKETLTQEIANKARDAFEDMVKQGLVDMQFVQGLEREYDWEMPEFDFFHNDPDDIRKQEKYLFDEINSSSLNELEKEFVNEFDTSNVIKWWFRNTVKSETSGYYLQGWQRDKVYPDFLVATVEGNDGVKKYMVIESKGIHLTGNPDTQYKKELFKLIEDRMSHQKKSGPYYYFRVLEEGNWKAELSGLLE